MSPTNNQDYRKLFHAIGDSSKLNDQEIANVLKASFKNLNKLKGNTSSSCLFPNCQNIGVESSHLYSKGFLKLISENGKVITKSYFPKISGKKFAFTIEEIGISEAMTFPGFCKICEQKFKFENNISLKESSDYILQLLRTVCYQKRILEIEINSNSDLLTKINSLSVAKVQPIFKLFNAELKSISGINKIEYFLKNENRLLTNQLKKVDRIYKKFCLIYNKQLSATVLTIHLPRSLPFFASYVGSLRIGEDEKISISNIVINIHPIKTNETEIFLVDFSKRLTKRYFQKLSLDEQVHFFAAILKLSTNWLMNKKYWSMLSFETKNKILEHSFRDENGS